MRATGMPEQVIIAIPEGPVLVLRDTFRYVSDDMHACADVAATGALGTTFH